MAHPPTVSLEFLGLICAVKELALEELHSHHSKDEHEEHVHNEDVEDVLEGIHHTVKHSLRQKKRREVGSTAAPSIPEAPVGSNSWVENIGGRWTFPILVPNISMVAVHTVGVLFQALHSHFLDRVSCSPGGP